MLVTMKTAGRFGIGDYNQSVPIKFFCAHCWSELIEDKNGFVQHPSDEMDGLKFWKTRPSKCPQAGKRAYPYINLQEAP